MKLSLIIPVLDSHEMLRRYLLYLESIVFGDDIEIIIMDDGSEIPLTYSGKLPVSIYQTHDKRPWTSSLARNIAARKYAKGEYLIMLDIDHIITPDALQMARTFGGQKIQFEREFAVLQEDGTITQDHAVLMAHGVPAERLAAKGVHISPHQNMYIMRKDVFLEIGGYREDLVNRPYPQGEDMHFKKKWYQWEREGRGKVHPIRPVIYVFPTGYQCGEVDYNPFGLFHNLSRKSKHNRRYREQLSREMESKYAT